jgi:phosphoribosylformimino-5-aminoimidazole carboxamide ribotide isomerase
MMVIPAIDLKDGRCVRLRQGDMAQETTYSDDPAAMARQWEALGAERLHIVDLNGAVNGKPHNMEQVRAIAAAVSIPIHVGGGVRSLEVMEEYFSFGVDRVVLGTAALENRAFLNDACVSFPEKIFVGVDVKQGKVALHGWTNLSESTAEHVLTSLKDYPLAGVIFTEISRDGMLKGPNLQALRDTMQASPVPLIASGGVARVEDIRAIKRLGQKIIGVIVGKALYEGTLDLTAALAEARA